MKYKFDKIKTAFLLFISISMIFSGTNTIIASGVTQHGHTGDPVQNYQSIIDCTDPALTYFNCGNYNPSSHNIGSVTVAVIDAGLTSTQWRLIENNNEGINVDIIKYVTIDNPSDFNSIQTFGQLGIDSSFPSRLNNYQQNHGLMVLSSLATIARDVKVVFLDVQVGETSSDPEGFAFSGQRQEIWRWLSENSANLDIDIITTSLSVTNSLPTDLMWPSYRTTFENQNIFMIAAAGNNPLKYLYPMQHPTADTYWHAIGGVQHEANPPYYQIGDSYGSWGANSPGWDANQWVLPANGVPSIVGSHLEYFIFWGRVYFYEVTDWEYASGTSFSAPYLAGIVAVAISAYQQGIAAWCGTTSLDPSFSQISGFLTSAQSGTTFDQKLGWGLVDVNAAYGVAYNAGYDYGHLYWDYGLCSYLP